MAQWFWRIRWKYDNFTTTSPTTFIHFLYFKIFSRILFRIYKSCEIFSLPLSLLHKLCMNAYTCKFDWFGVTIDVSMFCIFFLTLNLFCDAGQKYLYYTNTQFSSWQTWQPQVNTKFTKRKTSETFVKFKNVSALLVLRIILI